MLNSLIGIIASSGGVTSTNSYESISTVTVGSGGSSSITFSSIPSTYQHLQIRALGRASRSGAEGYFQLRFNSDSGNNYPYHILIGDGSTASAAGATATNYGYVGVMSAGTSTSGVFGTTVIDILDYANTNKNKTVRYLSGYDNNGNGILRYGSTAWLSTSAITQIDLSELYGTNYTQYSSFALYGIKG